MELVRKQERKGYRSINLPLPLLDVYHSKRRCQVPGVPPKAVDDSRVRSRRDRRVVTEVMVPEANSRMRVLESKQRNIGTHQSPSVITVESDANKSQ